MGIVKKRREARRLKRRLKDIRAVIGDKAEQRRQAIEDKQNVRRRIEKKKGRDPVQEKRKEKLEKDIARLHDELMAYGRREQSLERRLNRLNKRRVAVRKAYRKAKRKVKKALRQSGPDKALKAANKDMGKTEQPPGSNWGGVVRKMILWTGYSGPVYWCGCAVAWWTLKKAGGKYDSKIRRGYAGYIADDARNNRNGLKAISKPEKAAVVTLWGYQHIELCAGKADSHGYVNTRGGNTSPAPGSGSESNGGGCFPRKRHVSEFDVIARQEF